MSEQADRELREDVGKKARRLALAKDKKTNLMVLLRTTGIGWVFVLPLIGGAFGGRLLARVLGVPQLTMIGLGLGLAAGSYGVARQIRQGLEEEPDSTIRERNDE